MPFISLIYNILVVSSGLRHFGREGYVEVWSILPWISFSIPAALIGGTITVTEKILVMVLEVSLCLSGIRILWPRSNDSYFIQKYGVAFSGNCAWIACESNWQGACQTNFRGVYLFYIF